jgi:predicted RNA-binding Zn ribbon-like protein
MTVAPAHAAAAPAPQTIIRIALPGPLLDHFEAQSLISGVSLEQQVVDHLYATRDYAGDRAPIYLNDRESSEVRKLLGGRIKKGADLVDMVRRLCSWKVGGYKLALRPAVQEQIAEYAKALNKPIEEAGPELIETAIREKFRV